MVIDDKLAFWAYGTPRPQGSKKHVGNGRMVEQSKHLKEWRAVVTEAASRAMRAAKATPTPKPTPIEVTAVFKMDRPKRLKSGDFAEHLHTSTPDGDKLERAILDAMTGVVYEDDSQVAVVNKRKRYAYPNEDPGVFVIIRELM